LNQHHHMFAKYVNQYDSAILVDVGGGSVNISKIFLAINDDVHWIIIDMIPTLDDARVNIINELFD